MNYFFLYSSTFFLRYAQLLSRSLVEIVPQYQLQLIK